MKWLLLGNILNLAYKSTLNSTLVTIQYEDAINTMNDMAKSGLPLFISENVHQRIKNDPRQAVREIYKNILVIQWDKNGTTSRKLDYM